MRLSMLRLWLVLSLLAVTAVLAPGTRPAVGLAASLAAPTPTTTFETRFAVDPPLRLPFEAVQMIVDFPPGAEVARHTHGGPAYITMLDQTLTMWMDGDPERTYGPGESWVEPVGVYGSGANRGEDTARLIVTYLLPVGAPLTTLEHAGAVEQLPVGAVVQLESRMRLETVPPAYDVVQGLRTYPPGAWTASQLATASRLLTVVEGDVTVLVGDQMRTLGRGEHWIEMPGRAWLSGNPSAEPAVVAVTTIEPR